MRDCAGEYGWIGRYFFPICEGKRERQSSRVIVKREKGGHAADFEGGRSGKIGRKSKAWSCPWSSSSRLKFFFTSRTFSMTLVFGRGSRVPAKKYRKLGGGLKLVEGTIRNEGQRRKG